MPKPPRTGVSAEARLLKLAAYLHDQGAPVTREQIYEAFPDDYRGSDAAREKKFTRDKDALLALGLALQFDEGEGENGAYVLDVSSSFLPSLSFTPEEAAVVWAAGQAALVNHEHPLAEDLETALRKLAVGATGIPPRAAALEAEPRADESKRTRKLLDAVTGALAARRRVRLRYRNASGVETDRLLDVYGYAWRRGEWIVVGHCHLRDATRLFYLRRFVSVRLAPATPRGPDYRVPSAFQIRSWSGQEPWNYLAHEARPAAVRFRGSLLPTAKQLLPGASWTKEADGSLTGRLEVRNLPGLVRQALAWGPDAELVEPADGREMALGALTGLLERLDREVAP
jgi:predicted DNA-binding transcriptional regulator YafY